MGFAVVRPFFRGELKKLGFQEWPDGFNFENIPSTIQDGAFHISIIAISGSPASHQVHDFTYQVVVRVFQRAFRDVGEKLDDIDALSDTILEALLKPSIRLGTDIKDIVPVSIQPLALDVSNDNAIILEFNFDVILRLCFDN